jgi:hypothetical protein
MFHTSNYPQGTVPLWRRKALPISSAYDVLYCYRTVLYCTTSGLAISEKLHTVTRLTRYSYRDALGNYSRIIR